MKKFLLLVFVCATFNVFAQIEDDAKFTGTLLWKISGRDLKESSYIFGSHHVIGTEYVNDISGFWDAFNSSKQVVGEILMSDTEEIQAKIMTMMLMPASYSYKGVLSEEEYVRLDKNLKEAFGSGMETFSSMHPAMISLLYVTTLFTNLFPGKEISSIDMFVQELAKEKNKTILGLETVNDQIYLLFNTESIETQIKDLECGLNNQEYARKSLMELTHKYLQADLDGLYKIALDSENPCPSSTEMENAMNKERNDNWLLKLPDIMQKPSFIVVGALHLAGEEGLLFQLDIMGYTVEPVY